MTAQHKIQARIVALYLPKVKKALRAQVAEVTKTVRESGVVYARIFLNTHDFNKHIGPIIMGLYKDGGIANANKIESGLAVNKAGQIVKYRTLGHNAQWTKEIIEYFRAHLLDKVVNPISETTRARVLAVLNDAIENGWSVDETVNRLNAPELTTARAKLIVRTESTRAINYGGMVAAYNNKFEMEKTWNEVKSDSRTRLSHRHTTGVGGEKRALLERFSNGLMFPGDPDGSAAEVCNCRCTLSYSPVRDANGRLVRKPVPQVSNSTVVGSTRPTLARVLIEGAIGGLFGHYINELLNP